MISTAADSPLASAIALCILRALSQALGRCRRGMVPCGGTAPANCELSKLNGLGTWVIHAQGESVE